MTYSTPIEKAPRSVCRSGRINNSFVSERLPSWLGLQHPRKPSSRLIPIQVRAALICFVWLMFNTAIFGREIPASDPSFSYSGYANIDIQPEHVRFDRLIDAESGFRHDNPGVSIFFRTNAESVTARFLYNGLRQLVGSLNGTGVWFIDGKPSGEFHTGAERPGPVEVAVLSHGGREERTFELRLPYGESVDFQGITVNDGATLVPIVLPKRIRYVAYGDSITHGFSASKVTNTYPYMLAAKEGWELVNMGFGGREATASDGLALAAISPDVVTILMGFNDYYLNKPLLTYEQDLQGILRGIRTKCPLIPIYLITPLWSTEPLPTKLGLRLEDYRAVVRRVAGTANDPHLHLIEGPDLIPNLPEYFTDGIHPNDAGFQKLAETLEEKIIPRPKPPSGETP